MLKSSLLFNAAARAISRWREPSARQALQSARSVCSKVRRLRKCHLSIKPWWKGDLWWNHQVRGSSRRSENRWPFGRNTLWSFSIAIENCHRNSWFPHEKWWFSTVFFACWPGEFPFYLPRPWPGPLRSPPLRDHPPEGYRAEQRPPLSGITQQKTLTEVFDYSNYSKSNSTSIVNLIVTIVIIVYNSIDYYTS